MNVLQLKKDIRKLADPKKAKHLQRFFKTGKGEYAEGDVFLGIVVPQSRILAKKYKDLDLNDLKSLIASKYHEERLIALFILINKYNTTNHKKICFHFYIKNMKYINNWDLVDLSAPNIVGKHLFTIAGSSHLFEDFSKPIGNTKTVNLNNSDKTAARASKIVSNEIARKISHKEIHPFEILEILSKSENLWERRIAVLATFWFIKNNRFEESLKISEMLLYDKHDLMRKAVGWMLREIGKRDQKILIKFLDKHCKVMPRTMLRYAIEKFPEMLRKHYLGN
jgi:3-methyladenine DNA glycosylase AlkD